MYYSPLKPLPPPSQHRTVLSRTRLKQLTLECPYCPPSPPSPTHLYPSLTCRTVLSRMWLKQHLLRRSFLVKLSGSPPTATPIPYPRPTQRTAFRRTPSSSLHINLSVSDAYTPHPLLCTWSFSVRGYAPPSPPLPPIPFPTISLTCRTVLSRRLLKQLALESFCVLH